MSELARIIVYGDIHLSSKNYGGHKDYAKESLSYFKEITKAVEQYGATHLIGTGDLTFGRFQALEYRDAVEAELNKQYKLVQGNRYEVKGNHDSATYGMTEYEFYQQKGLLKKATNLTIGDVNISMVNNGEYKTTEIIKPSENTIDIVIAHDYFKFENTQLPNYGKAIILDNFEQWFGVDLLLCGHVHNHFEFTGDIIKDNRAHRMGVNYLGCMSRPSYREDLMDDIGHLVLLTIHEDGRLEIGDIEVELWPIEESFNLAKKEAEFLGGETEEKRVKLDISDIVHDLDTYERVVGNPEDIIAAMPDLDERCKKKAIELLKLGQQ